MARTDPRTPQFFEIAEGLDDDELPDDKEADAPRTVWELVGEFRGVVTGARVLKTGEAQFTIDVPYEDKYVAMPITDTRGVLMVFAAYKPTRAKNDTKDDTESHEG